MARRTPEREDRISRHYDQEFDPQHLKQLEKNYAESPDASDMDQIENFANDPQNATKKSNTEESDTSKNIDKVRDKENSMSYAPWQNKVTGTNKSVSGKPRKKKSALFFVIALVFGGGAGFSVLLAPAGALVWIKETVFNKVDTMSSVVGSRSDLILRDQMFSTNTTCKIKVRCKFSGISEYQMKRLQANGAQLLDKNDKPVKRNSLRRYTGGKTLVMNDGTRISASSYRSALRSNSELRSLSRSVFSPRYVSWNDSVAKKIRAEKRLVTDPDWGTQNDDENTRQKVFAAVSGNSAEYNKTANASPTNNTPGDKKKADGGKEIDAGNYTDAINNEANRLDITAKKGGHINPLPSEPVAVLGMQKQAASSGLKKIFNEGLSALNPVSFAAGACYMYGTTRAIVTSAKTISLINKMRYASLFLSTADKLKAGDLKPGEAEKAMTILERPDVAGDAFGDAVGYQYPAYGTVPSKPLAASASGNGTVLFFASMLGWMNGHFPGGKKSLKTSCKIMTNIGVQIAFSVFSFIPGVGQLASGISKIVSVGAKQVAKETVDSITKKLSEKLTKDALKKTIKENRARILTMAGTAGGLFIAQALIERYAIPYLARVMSGTELTGSEDGVTAMDSITTGAGAINASTALERGMTPLTPSQAVAFNQFSQSSLSTYVADMKAESNPFDTSDPYSLSNTLAAAYYPVISKINISNPSSLLASVGSVFSTLSDSVFTKAFAAKNTPNVTSCQDTDATGTGIAFDPMCNPIIGFSDPGMLQNTDPNDVVDYMYNTRQIDDNGDAIPGSAYEEFYKKCINDSSEKTISAGDVDSSLDPSCYGKKDDTYQHKMFRLYFIDDTTKTDMDGDLGDYVQSAPEDNGGTETANLAQPPNTTKFRNGWKLTKGQDYTEYKCAAGTKDKGVYTNRGNNTTIRLCAFKGVQINAMISERVVKIFKAAKAAGISLMITSGWRSYETQAALYAAHPGNAAPPGSSNHESGLAIDVGLAKPIGKYSSGAFCYPPDDSRVATCPGNPGYEFMVKTAPKYGMYKLSSEAWHYDTAG